jgi:RNA polymerase sigma-70 factor (sigma-E family)
MAVTDFDDFASTRGPALLRFAYLLTGDAHAAEDLVQEGLARAHLRWSKLQHFDLPEAYVRKAMLNHYLSWRRRRSSTEIAVARPPDRAAADSDAAERVVVRHDLWRLLLTLPRMQRAVLVLRYYEDLDDEHIAGLLGCARPTVRVHVARALQRLRAALPEPNHPLEV